MRLVIALMGLVLAGCWQQYTGPSAAEINQQCGGNTKPFAESWPCVRAGLGPLPVDADLKSLYIATGDFVVEQIQSGNMTDSEAKMAMAGARQKINSEVISRQNAAAQRDSITDAVVLGSIMNRPPVGSTYQSPIMPAPRQPVQCYRTGNSVQCY